MWYRKKIFVVFVIGYFIHRIKEDVYSVPLEDVRINCGGGVKECVCVEWY